MLTREKTQRFPKKYFEKVNVSSNQDYILHVIVSFQLKKAKTTPFFPASCKNFISDFAVIIAIGSMALLDYGVGVDTPKLSVPDTIRPTWEGRGWLIHPLGKRQHFSGKVFDH